VSAYIEFYEGVHEHDYIPGCFAMCGECDWDGPHRDTIAEAQADADVHECVAGSEEDNAAIAALVRERDAADDGTRLSIEELQAQLGSTDKEAEGE
jgi:Na+-translocating ferredoxin:NAD+ oxidoreductase RNF subunit RnfB